MVTIIKVKRKIDDDPVECLIIESKKKKIDSVDNESINYILKYAGTAKSEVFNKKWLFSNNLNIELIFVFKNDIPYKINELNKQIRTKNDIQAEYKLPRAKRLKNVINKQTAIDDAKNDNKSQRYILLNKKRGLDEQNEDVNIIDVISSDYLDDLDKEKEKEDEIETSKKVRSGLSDHLRFVRNQLLFSNKDDDEISCNGVPLIKEKSNKNASEYIYDIYYAKNDSNSTYLDLLDSNNYNIKSYYGDENDYLINDEADDEFRNAYQDDEDEDSNDENNWKNDYPDEDGEHCDDYYNEYDYGM